MKKVILIIMFSAGFLLILNSCGNFKKKDTLKPANDLIKINNPWIRPSGAGMNSAFFFEVINDSDLPDTLYAAESHLAEIVQMHETYKNEAGMKGMREVDSVVINPHSHFNFKPGGNHIMLINLAEDLKSGGMGEITLKFKRTGSVKIAAPVKEN